MKRTNMLMSVTACLAVIGLLFTAGSAQALTWTWTGNVDNDWFEGNNWDDGLGGGSIPADGSDNEAIIDIDNAGVLVGGDGGETRILTVEGDGDQLTLDMGSGNNFAVEGYGGSAGVRGASGTGDVPTVTHKSGRFDCDNFSVGSGGEDGIYNQTGGELEMNFILSVGNGAGSVGTYNLTGGLVDLNSERDSAIGVAGGTGTLNIDMPDTPATQTVLDGNILYQEFEVGVGDGSVGTVNQNGGRANYRQLNIGDNTDGVTSSGTYNLDQGRLYITSHLNVRDGGTLNIARGATADAHHNSSISAGGTIIRHADSTLQHADNGTFDLEGTLRTIIGTGDVSPFQADQGINTVGANSALEVEFEGGVLMTSQSSYDLISGSMPSGYSFGTNTPNSDLWITTEATDSVSVALNGPAKDTLSAGTVGASADLDGGQHKAGYIDLTWSETPADGILSLGLDLTDDGVSSAEFDALVDEFMADLDAVDGYSAYDLSGYTLGLDLDANGEDYFMWDLSPYSNSPGLLMDSFEVVPEPSTILLLGLAGLLLMKRRRV